MQRPSRFVAFSKFETSPASSPRGTQRSTSRDRSGERKAREWPPAIRIDENASQLDGTDLQPPGEALLPAATKRRTSPDRYKFSRATMEYFNLGPEDLKEGNRALSKPQSDVDFVDNNIKIA